MSFLVKRDARFKVFWPQLCSLEHQYVLSNIFEDVKLLAQQQSMFFLRQWWLQKVLFYSQFAKNIHPRLTKQLEQQVQLYLEQLMKDLVSYSLNINISVQSNTCEKKLFDLAVLAIDYYRPIQPFIPTKSIFFWLDGWSPLVGPPTNPNHTKSESHSDNYNISRKGNKMSWTEEILPTDLNCTKNKSHGNICRKTYYNTSDEVSI